MPFGRRRSGAKDKRELSMNDKCSKWLKVAAKAVISIGLFYWVFSRGSLDLYNVAKTFTLKYFVIINLLLYFTFAMNTMRWLIIMNSRGIAVPFKVAMPLTYIGLFFNFAIPGGVSGDLIKGYYLLKFKPDQKLSAATSVLMDRFIGLYSMILLASIAVILNFAVILQNAQLFLIATVVLSLLLGLSVVTIVMFSKIIFNSSIVSTIINIFPLKEKIKLFQKEVFEYREQSLPVIFSLLLSLGSQILTILAFYFSGLAMGYDIGILAYLFCVPVGLVLTVVPISPGGVGVGQAIYLVLFSRILSKDSSIGPDLFTSLQAYSLLWGAVGCVYFIKIKHMIGANAQREANII